MTAKDSPDKKIFYNSTQNPEVNKEIVVLKVALLISEQDKNSIISANFEWVLDYWLYTFIL